jgi:hypothetical protein
VARSRVTGASSGLASDLVLGRQIVTMIDASLTHALKTDSATLASWRQVKRATVKGAVPRKAVAVNQVVAGGAPVANGGAPVTHSSAPAAAPGGSVSNTAVPVVSTEGSETVGGVTPAIPSEIRAAQLGIGGCQGGWGNLAGVNRSATSGPVSFTGVFGALTVASLEYDSVDRATYSAGSGDSTSVRRAIHP